MNLRTRLTAGLVLGVGILAAGLTMGGVALAQDASPPPPATVTGTAPPTPPPDLSLPKSADPNTGYRTYSVPAPPDSSPGLYLPAVVGGYVKSTAGCVVAGCDDGPSVSAPPSSSGADVPPPAVRLPTTPGSPPPQ